MPWYSDAWEKAKQGADIASGILNPAGYAGRKVGEWIGGGGLGDAWDAAKDALAKPMREGDPEFRTPERSSYDLPGAAAREQRLLSAAEEARRRGAPQAQESAFRQSQSDLAEALARQARGEGPSLAEMQLRQATDRGIAQQQALAQSAAPGQAAMAQRLAAQQAGQMSSGLAGQSAMARLQEQQAAQGMLGNLLQGARGQDLQRGLANVGFGLQSRGMNDQAFADLLRQEAENARAQQAGGMGYEQARTQRYMGSLGIPTWLEGATGALSGLLPRIG